MGSKISKIQSGVAGEYFAAAELSRRGHVASITLRNTMGIDILASNDDGSRSVGIQVKTNQGAQKQWLLSKKAENTASSNLFFVFVNLHSGEAPTFHVVPSAVVAARCAQSHREWLSEPKRDGTPRKDTPMRVFSDEPDEFLDNWESLGLVT